MDKKQEKIEYEKLALIFKQIALLINDSKTNGTVLNRYEYYLHGGLPFRKALSIIYRLCDMDLITKDEYGVLHNYLEEQALFGASRNKEFILKTYYQFGDYVINYIEKENIWKSLNDLGLEDKDIDDLVFAGAVRAYAYDKGLIKKKVLTKKEQRKNNVRR